jgi:hypothetical protein
MTAPALGTLLADLDRALLTLAHPEIPAALGELERLKAACWTRLTLPGNGAAHPEPAAPDRNLEPEDAAERLGVTLRWLKDNGARLPFRRKLGHRTIRYSEAGLTKWLAAHRVGTTRGSG